VGGHIVEGAPVVVRVIAFDVNETLLDLAALDEPLARVFGSAAPRPLWFAQMLQLAFVGTIIGEYVDFGTAQHAALRMLAARTGAALDPAGAEAIVAGMRRLPPHPEVRGALATLRGSGLAVAALTNSTLDVAEDQLVNAGLRDLFDDVFSADDVRRLKPAPEPYAAVAAKFEVPLGGVRLVAAHAWDISGALAAGCRAAFVARPGMVLSPLGRQPDIAGPDLTAVVDRILDVDRPH
jgi:2-haloacid dehalogenase